MPVVKVTDIAYIRLRSPNLETAERFLSDFGMQISAKTPTALYMRGTDAPHHLHITELGPPAFLALGYHAASEADLEALARIDGASAVEPTGEPGGGKRVRLRDPHGFTIEVIHGMERLPELPIRGYVLNHGADKLRRKGELFRISRGPSQVKRIGHGVLMTTDLPRAVQWYRDTLGFICSDDVYAGDASNVIGSFNRCDRGEDYVDHHVFFCMAGHMNGLNHASFEVHDVDDLMVGHEYLSGTYEHVWGVGRHVLGSQIFDYWKDPWGRIHEHWTDSDVLNAETPPNRLSVEEGLNSQWGVPAPPEITQHASV